MKDSLIGPEETNSDLKRSQCRLFETAREQPSVKSLEVRPPVHPIGSDVDEVHILGHDLCELMPIVFRPGCSKCLRNIPDCGFIGFSLGMNDAPGDKKYYEQVAQ